MKISLKHGLLALNILSCVLILVIYLSPVHVLRIILGIPFLLFFPGYAFMAALFSRKEEMSGIQRVVLSFGLSIAIVPLIGFIINYTPWGIKLESIMYSVASFILVCSVVAWLRQRKLIEEERLTIDFLVTMPGWGEGIRDRILTVILVAVILGVLGTIGYFVAAPKAGETFTEFYLLGQQNETANYPTELELGDTGTIVVGIINHEGTEVSYRVEVVISSNKGYEIGPIILADEEKLETKVVFIPDAAGENQKIEVFLYKYDEVETTLGPLNIWVDVRER
jgi:uncharacterized membrane protein